MDPEGLLRTARDLGWSAAGSWNPCAAFHQPLDGTGVQLTIRVGVVVLKYRLRYNLIAQGYCRHAYRLRTLVTDN
jgi:hypothetical protein